MISKQKNFSDILKTLPHFKKDSIILISHVNNLTTLESNLIKSVCQKNQVVTFYVKLNLLKKLSKNELFNNLLKGPTQLYFFNNTSDILPFIEDPLVKKKIIPLAIF
jgi:ribosomal protein L10